MRLAWATDIHLDFLGAAQIAAFGDELRATGAEAVVLTGDLSVASKLGPDLAALVRQADLPFYFVAGNHDYYGVDIASVRAGMRRIADVEPRLMWLPHRGVVRLGARTALIGVDGWADGRLGDPEGTTVLLNDHVVIPDLRTHSRERRLEIVRELGDREAETLRGLLGEALAPSDHVYVATHIPPFAEASTHEGRPCGPDWLPWMTCAAVGEVLREAARAHPSRRITVLAGHTHDRCRVSVEPNLDVWVGKAVYGAPAVEDVLEIA
ncbi:MAG: metallophosphoesterase [Sandaracinaceae bacterium]